LTQAIAGLKEGEKCREKGYFFTLPPDSDRNGSSFYKNSVKVVNPKRGSRDLLHFPHNLAPDFPQYVSGKELRK